MLNKNNSLSTFKVFFVKPFDLVIITIEGLLIVREDTLLQFSPHHFTELAVVVAHIPAPFWSASVTAKRSKSSRATLCFFLLYIRIAPPVSCSSTLLATACLFGGCSCLQVRPLMTCYPCSISMARSSTSLFPDIEGQDRNAAVSISSTEKGRKAIVQVLKRPAGAFGALMSSASKRKLDASKKGKEEAKLEQIRSSVSLLFHSSFLGSSEKSKIVEENPSVAASESEASAVPNPVCDNPVSASSADENILLDFDTGPEDTVNYNPESTKEDMEKNPVLSTSGKENEYEPMSLSELSSSFEKYFQPNTQNNRNRLARKTEESGRLLEVKPFDYEAAREQVRFGEDATLQEEDDEDGILRRRRGKSGGKKKNLTVGRGETSDLAKELPPARRRQAFPASGNRSATFR
ncbi:hypothetical protein K1719_008592 [Acacia pycnantha]|nr:hypothetical protein K1719_008592 [Acacia pycnantha]